MSTENTFGKKLLELRKRNGLTQIQLSKQIHIDVKAIKNWEAGLSNPCIESVVSVARFFNVTSDELLGLSTDGKVIIIPNSLSKKDQESILQTLRAALQAFISSR